MRWYDHPPVFNSCIFPSQNSKILTKQNSDNPLHTLRQEWTLAMWEIQWFSGDHYPVSRVQSVQSVHSVHSDDGTNCPREKLPPRYKLSVAGRWPSAPLLIPHRETWLRCIFLNGLIVKM